MAKSVEASRKAALAYIAQRNGNGQFDDVLYALAEGRLDVGLIEYDGEDIAEIEARIREIDRKLQAPPAERLDSRIDALKAERTRLAETVLVARHFVANPILYTMKVA
jgi:hypothetical protein